MSDSGPAHPAHGALDLRVDEARAAIHAALRPLAETQAIALSAALGRVLAADVISPIDVPAHDNSAMDGYALNGSELQPGQPVQLRIVATVLAGAPLARSMAPGECVRIMTGAVMPDGLDTVVPQELCEASGGLLRIDADVVHAGDNRRLRGEDLARGRAALRAGRRLGPADLGLVASLGLTGVNVFRRLRVAVFSTGNELRSAGEPLGPGCIYDSNRHSLMAAVQRLGLQALDLGLVRDEPAALQAALARASAQADVVLVSGGVSGGDADHTRELLNRSGELAFWKVAMRPGRPLAFGTLRRAPGNTATLANDRPVWLFALPGNPVAALTAFYVFARDALLLLAGATEPPLASLRARTLAPIRKRAGRSEYLRGVVSRGADGDWQVRLTGPQGSGVLRSMSEANALLLLPQEQGPVAAGDWVEVWLFDGLT
ncbi:MAG TPA: gephyrin-like molybdotransferase Glp [Ideonella sp.]|nr:gephyrin-like molybdotransferase Glp [Ideonella sp.]